MTEPLPGVDEYAKALQEAWDKHPRCCWPDCNCDDMWDGYGGCPDNDD